MKPVLENPEVESAEWSSRELFVVGNVVSGPLDVSRETNFCLDAMCN